MSKQTKTLIDAIKIDHEKDNDLEQEFKVPQKPTYTLRGRF